MRTTRIAGIGAVVVLAPALIGIGLANAQAASTHQHYAFYEKNSSLTYRTASGHATALKGAPAAGSAITFSDLDYRGTNAKHAAAPAASDYFVCAFNSHDVPTCNGEITVGNSTLLVYGTGGQGTFTLPIVGGTNAFRHDTGTLKIADIGDTLNANVVVSASRK